MGRIVVIACMAGLTLSLSSPAFADDPERCDMLCRLKSYLATDHMAPAPAEAAASKAGAAKHARSTAGAHKHKPAVAAAPAPTVPEEAKPAPAPKTANILPGRPKAVTVAEAKSAPSPERHRSVEKAVAHPAKTAVAARAEAAAARIAEAPPVVPEPPPKRAATRVATLATGRFPVHPSVQSATPAETTTSSTTTIPGSAPLVAAGFR